MAGACRPCAATAILGLVCAAGLFSCGGTTGSPSSAGVFRTAVLSLTPPVAEAVSVAAAQSTTSDIDTLLASMQPRVIDEHGNPADPNSVPVAQLANDLELGAGTLWIGNDAYAHIAGDTTLHGYVLFVHNDNASAVNVHDVRARVKKAYYKPHSTMYWAAVLIRQYAGPGSPRP